MDDGMEVMKRWTWGGKQGLGGGGCWIYICSSLVGIADFGGYMYYYMCVCGIGVTPVLWLPLLHWDKGSAHVGAGGGGIECANSVFMIKDEVSYTCEGTAAGIQLAVGGASDGS